MSNHPMRIPTIALLSMLAVARAVEAQQVAAVWPFEQLTAQADLVVIAEYMRTEDTGRRTTPPEAKSGVAVEEFRTHFTILQVLKDDGTGRIRTGGTLALRHYAQADGQVIVNAGASLAFPNLDRPYLLFLKRVDDAYEPLSGERPTASVFLLSSLGSLPPVPSHAVLPNMTGKWTLVNVDDAPPGSARHLEIDQDSRTFKVVASDGQRPSAGAHDIGIVGGSVGGAVIDSMGGRVVDNGERTEHSAIVKDGALVIESARYFQDSASGKHSTWRSEVWSLAGDRLTVEISERQDDRQIGTALLVYRRSGTRRE